MISFFWEEYNAFLLLGFIFPFCTNAHLFNQFAGKAISYSQRPFPHACWPTPSGKLVFCTYFLVTGNMLSTLIYSWFKFHEWFCQLISGGVYKCNQWVCAKGCPWSRKGIGSYQVTWPGCCLPKSRGRLGCQDHWTRRLEKALCPFGVFIFCLDIGNDWI